MILLFWMWMLITGLAVSSLFWHGQRPFFALALVPVGALLLPVSLIIVLALFYKANALMMWTLWIPGGLLLVFKQRRALQDLFDYFKSRFQQQRRLPRLLVGMIFTSLMVMLLRNTMTSLWPGDGMIHWGRKAMDWYTQGRFEYTPAVSAYVQTWSSYPIYHSLTQWFSLLALPYPIFLPIKAINLYDGFCLWGIALTGMAIVSLLTENLLAIASAGVMVAFGQRPLVEAMGSGYAELHLTYLSLLFFGLTLASAQMKTGPMRPLLQGMQIGLIAGLLTVTKQEGIFRLVTMLVLALFLLPGTSPLSVHALKKSWRTLWPFWTGFFLLLLGVLGMERILHPAGAGVNVYEGRTVFSLAFMIHKFPHLSQAFYASFKQVTRSFSQSSLIWSHALLLLLIFSPRLKKADAGTRSQFFWYPLGVYGCGLVFNLLPDLVSTNSFHLELADPAVYAYMVLVRLHSQLGPFLMLALIFPLMLEKNHLKAA